MYSIKRLWLTRDSYAHKKWAELMEEAGLTVNEEIDYTVGIYSEDKLVATGSFFKNIIKCLVVREEFQSESLLLKVIQHLTERLHEENQLHYFVYTKPSNFNIFKSLGFREIIFTDDTLFMEQGSPDFQDYLEMLRIHKKPGLASSIVMNANPFTKGHQYLVEKAASESQQVYVFVLTEDRSEFSNTDRFEMVKQGVEHLSNVTVLPTNDYLISSATFPSYFLKDAAYETVAQVQATLDATLFKEKIAPVLEITQRFVGEEPFSKVTEIYNQSLKKVFAEEIQLVVVPRIASDGQLISATKVRNALKNQDMATLESFLPPTTYKYLQEHNKLSR